MVAMANFDPLPTFKMSGSGQCLMASVHGACLEGCQMVSDLSDPATRWNV